MEIGRQIRFSPQEMTISENIREPLACKEKGYRPLQILLPTSNEAERTFSQLQVFSFLSDESIDCFVKYFLNLSKSRHCEKQIVKNVFHLFASLIV